MKSPHPPQHPIEKSEGLSDTCVLNGSICNLNFSSPISTKKWPDSSGVIHWHLSLYSGNVISNSKMSQELCYGVHRSYITEPGSLAH